VDFAPDVDLIDYADEAEVAAVPLFERVYRLPPLYPRAHVVEQAEPSPVVAAATPSDSSAAEQVRTCASSTVCSPKPWCTCSWEWLPRELPEVTPDGDHAQRHIDDDEDEATTSTTSKPSGTFTWEWIDDDVPEVTNKRKWESDQGEKSCNGKRRRRLWR
jgi:hypothetical protein